MATTYQSKASEHKLAFLLVFFWVLFQPAFAEEPEPPWDGGTIPITGSPWLNCKGLPDPDNDGKPVKGEGGGMPKCGGGGVPPIPGSGNPPAPGDGGGGSGPGNAPQQGPVLEQSEDADDDINCNNIGEIRKTYARVEVVQSRLTSGTIGNALNGFPIPNSPFTVQYSNGQRESFIAGPYGSPTIAVGSSIPGTCH